MAMVEIISDTINTISESVRDLMRNSILLKAAQRYLLLLGFGMAFGLLLVILVPIIIPSLQNEAFAATAPFLVNGLLITGTYFVLIGVLRINIRSMAEREEERARKKLIDMEIELKILDFRFNNPSSMEDQGDSAKKYDELKLEYDILISKTPQGWGQNISTDWGKTLIATRNRLLDEEQRLRARNFANLAYGILAASIGIIILISIATIPHIWVSLKEPSVNGIPIYYFPSVPIAIISEFVAIFFLRLFAQTEQSIEKNKNEMTNTELRLTACQLLEYETDKKDKDKFNSLADTLSKEERNFVLKKNESSATSETIDNKKLLEIISKLAMKAGGI